MTTTSPDPTKPDTEARNTFLARFPDNRRSYLTNLFLSGPRRGLTDPQDVLDHVWKHLQAGIDHTRHESARNREQLLAETIATFPDEARAFAQWAIHYVEQPAEQREEARRTQQEEHIARWLAEQPASEKQIAYLRSLGHQGEIASKLEASRLIEHLKQGGKR
jgi:hypothetical protein